MNDTNFDQNEFNDYCMTWEEKQKVKSYNEMVYLIKNYRWVAIPRNYEKYVFKKDFEFVKLHVEFGQYTMSDDIDKLKYAKTCSDIKNVYKVKVSAKIKFSDFSDDVNYIDNFIVFLIRKEKNVIPVPISELGILFKKWHVKPIFRSDDTGEGVIREFEFLMVPNYHIK